MGEPQAPSSVGDHERFAASYPRLRRFATVVSPGEIDPDDLLQEAASRMASTWARRALRLDLEDQR